VRAWLGIVPAELTRERGAIRCGLRTSFSGSWLDLAQLAS
jgi:hypothetical protein